MASERGVPEGKAARLSEEQDAARCRRVEDALYRFFQNLWTFTRSATIHNWASLRWFEALIPLYWLYERRPEDWMLRLARRLQQQGFDYERLFAPYANQEPERVWTYETHVVNLAMALKQGALTARMDGGDPGALAHRMLDALLRHHGMAVGHFTGDECVMGDSPIQGTAADIIKIAMVRVADELKKRGLQTRLILQVHDELILEAPESEAEEAAELLRSCMEGVMQLKVPLRTDISTGGDWRACK